MFFHATDRDGRKISEYFVHFINVYVSRVKLNIFYELRHQNVLKHACNIHTYGAVLFCSSFCLQFSQKL